MPRRAQVCGLLLSSVDAGSHHAQGRICNRAPSDLGPVAAALVVLCGRPLSASTVREFAPDTKSGRSNLKWRSTERKAQLETLEKVLADMEPERLRKTLADATAAAAAATTAAAAAHATAPTAGQRRPREEDDDDEPGISRAEFKRLLPIEKARRDARRNPAGILHDHPHLAGLVISIEDADFTYFEWGEPDEDEDDQTPTRWFARVCAPAALWQLPLPLTLTRVCPLIAGQVDANEDPVGLKLHRRRATMRSTWTMLAHCHPPPLTPRLAPALCVGIGPALPCPNPDSRREVVNHGPASIQRSPRTGAYQPSPSPSPSPSPCELWASLLPCACRSSGGVQDGPTG